jgi:Ca2+-transporting ATPase
MGITGTDVAKGAADMILTDDNFATIVEAVKEGRGIYDNIRKAVEFLLGCNIGEILTVFVAMLLWKETPLLAMQLLWINLVTDGLPALALGMEQGETDIMKRKPRKKDESILQTALGSRSLFRG